MIATWVGWLSGQPRPDIAMAQSLGQFAGIPADQFAGDHASYFQLDGPRPRTPRRGWRPAECGPGWTVLFHGAFDNLDDIADELGLRDDPQARRADAVYGAAVLRWGDAADARIHGCYCTIIDTGRQSAKGVRLARSPWAPPPLAFVHTPERLIAGSALRALVAGGAARELDVSVLVEALYGAAERHDDRGWYKGVRNVLPGSIVWAGPEGTRVHRWYGADSIQPVRFARDEDYVEAANEQLSRAVKAALRGARRPGISLSGGLDSSILADEVTRQLAPGDVLPSFTWVTLPEWQEFEGGHHFGQERPFVEAFAAMHPSLRPHFFDNRDANYDEEMDRLSAASGQFTRLAHIAAPIHSAWRGAREQGCDLLLTAELGNDCYSSDGSWCYPEYLRNGRWGELYRALQGRVGDARSMPRRFAAMALLPHLPAGLRAFLRQLVHGGDNDLGQAMHVLRPEVIERYELERLNHTRQGIDRFEKPRSKREEIEAVINDDLFESGERQQAFEQVHGLRQRDPAGYRPLMELCLGMPTDQFIRGGTGRWLARRMGAGRMPEAQRVNRRYGQWGADWHMRDTPRLGRMRADVARLADHPWLGELIDVERMQQLVDSWPETSASAMADQAPHRYALPVALNSLRFVNWFEGRNG